ncbi:MAG: glycosyltransferase family 2 protein [Terracidiphilus sp.]|jgi:glycosyltransferase involved in cell wall biosynthesis
MLRDNPAGLTDPINDNAGVPLSAGAIAKMGQMNPLISAVIPTHNRPQLVCRAVRSALNQTYENLEVIVIIDGPEPATRRMLEDLQEPRMHVIELQTNMGISEVRNIGAHEAKGEWISFLSDDDEWLPHKIERQTEALTPFDPCTNFVACRYETRGTVYRRTLPRNFPKPQENLSEYIYCRSESINSGSLIRRDLIVSFPYISGLQINEDSDWLLRVHAAKRLRLKCVDETLAIIHQERTWTHLSLNTDWRIYVRWAQMNITLLTPKSFAACLLRNCVALAVDNHGNRLEVLRIIWTAWKEGAPRHRDVFFALARAISPGWFIELSKRALRRT